MGDGRLEAVSASDGAASSGPIPADSSANAADQIVHRRHKLQELVDAGTPLEYRYEVDNSAAAIATRWSDLAADESTTERVRVAGRLVLIRKHGGLTFGVLRDRTGTVQLFVDRAAIGAEAYRSFCELDRGDWIGTAGVVMRTEKGELSIAVDEVALLGKALRPLPDKDK